MSSTSDRHVSKKAKHGNTLPSHDEQKQLKQMDILMKNNLMGLQTVELIEETKTEKKFASKKFTAWLEILMNDLKRDDFDPKLSTDDCDELQFHNSGVSIDFIPPETIETIGALATKTTILPTNIVEIAVQIPNDIFTTRDILNHVYFDKRKLYLIGLYRLLDQLNAKHDTIPYKNMKFIYPKSDLRKPIIQVQPFYAESIYVHIRPMIADNVFKLTQLNHTKNNVRPASWMELLKGGAKDKDLDVSQLKPTPYYNLAIFEDIVIHTQQKILNKAIAPHENIRQAVILFKIWLTQRHFLYQLDGLEDMQIGLLIAYLIQIKVITIHATPISILQSIWTFFEQQDFEKNVFTFFHNEITPRVTAISTPYSVSVYDAIVIQLPYAQEGKKEQLHLYNNLWRISGSYLTQLRLASRRSLNEMKLSLSTSFSHLFLTPIPFFQSADLYYGFTVPSSWEAFFATAKLSGESKAKYEDISLRYPIIQYFTQRASEVLHRALGDRIYELISLIRHPHIPKFDTTFAHSDILDFSVTNDSEEVKDWEYVVTIGVILDNEKAFRKVDRGPAPVTAEDQLAHQKYEVELEEFRAFWGDKCQLRRFKDGAIVEAVVWEPVSEGNSKAKQTVLLIDEIIRHIWSLHLPVVCGTKSEYIIALPTKVYTPSITNTQSIVSKEQSVWTASQAYDEFRSLLLSKIANLPLTIENVAVMQSDLRYCNMIPPVASPLLESHFDEDETYDIATMKQFLKEHSGKELSYLFRPILINIQFESSGKWPTETEAIVKCKLAMLIKLKRELQSRFQMYTIIHDDSLDVCYHGFLFRLYASAGLDVEKVVIRSRESSMKEVEASINSQTKRKWLLPGLYHNAVKNFALRSIHFGESVQLVSIWLAKHSFSGHIGQEIIELLVAYELLHGNTYHPCANALQTFYRVLVRLTTHVWEDEPLLIDFGLEQTNEFTEDVKSMIMMKFQATRSTLANIADTMVAQELSPSMYLVTSLDKVNDYEPTFRGAMITPEPVVLQFIRLAAKKTVEKISFLLEYSAPVQNVLGEPESEQEQKLLENLFRNDNVLRQCQLTLSFADEIVIPDITKGPSYAKVELFVNTNIKQLFLSHGIVIEAAHASHPMQSVVVKKLIEAFHDEAIFFWNELSGKEVGVLFRPSFSSSSDQFAVLQTQYRQYRESTSTPAVTAGGNKKGKNQNASKQGSSSTKEDTVIANTPHYGELINHMIHIAEGLLLHPTTVPEFMKNHVAMDEE